MCDTVYSGGGEYTGVLPYFPARAIEAAGYLETSVNLYQTTRCHVSADSNIIGCRLHRRTLIVDQNTSRSDV